MSLPLDRERTGVRYKTRDLSLEELPMTARKVGILTGGGDCPGLNAVIRAVVRRAPAHGLEIVGIRDGWKGLMEPEGRSQPLTRESVANILHLGGTILSTSRTNPFKKPEGPETVQRSLKALGLDALIAIGGEDTLGVAAKLHGLGVKVVGVPKTIDNDLNGTDFTFGFDTAVMIATEAIDRIRTTAESHHRCMVVEVMGRHAGWIATYAGLAGGAHEILVPEIAVDLDEVCKHVRSQHATGQNYSIIVVAEGAKLRADAGSTQALDEFGHERLGGIWRDDRPGGRETDRLRDAGHRARAHPARGERRPPTTACWPPALESSPATSWGGATSARWRACAGRRSRPCRSTKRSRPSRPSTPSCSPWLRASSVETSAVACLRSFALHPGRASPTPTVHAGRVAGSRSVQARAPLPSAVSSPPAVREVSVAGPGRVDRLVAQALKVSRAEAARLVDSGAVRRQGRRVRKGDVLTAADRVEVEQRDLEELIPEPSLPLVVLAETEDYVVVDKRSGLACHPLRAGERGTVANALVARYPECRFAGVAPREAGLCHRLDRDTSGALLAARSAQAFERLRAQFSARTVEKVYLTVVRGTVSADLTLIEAPLAGRGTGSKLWRHASDGARLPAVTRLVTLWAGPQGSLLEVRIETGVRHQIRAHLASVGHPPCRRCHLRRWQTSPQG